MAILLTIEKISYEEKRTELRNKFRNRWTEVERNLGYVDAVGSIDGIDFDTTHDSVMTQLTQRVNEYIHEVAKVPEGMRVYLQYNFDLYIYDWNGGYLLQVPRIYQS